MIKHSHLFLTFCTAGTLALALALAACSSSGGPGGPVFNPDATVGRDTGTGQPDTGGQHPNDTGGNAPDSGVSNPDSGGGSNDAGPAADSGTTGNPDATSDQDALPAGQDAQPAQDATPNADATANPDATPPADSGTNPDATAGNHIQTIFLIMEENANWSDYYTNGAPTTNAQFIGSLVTMGAHSENYHGAHNNGVVLHPSEPNYIYLIAGDNFGIADDNQPSSNHQPAGTPNLGVQMNTANISWKSYQEDISGTGCPLTDQEPATGPDVGHGYRPKHNGFVFFDDLTGANDPNNAACQAHNRPMTELFTDLQANTVARFNLITPDLCHDGHDSCSPQNNKVQQIDDWLRMTVPMIMASQAYQNGGLIIITWDECSGFLCDSPLGMIMLSPNGKTNFTSNTNFDHASMLRTFQDILGLQPYLGLAAQATTMSEFFNTFP